MNHQALSSFIWSVADLLRGDYKQSEYGKVILPFTVLRRLDCVLEATKAAVLAELAKRKKAGLNPEPFLLRKSGQLFYNTSPLDMKKLMGDQDHIGENLCAYMQAFSPAVRDIFERFDFHTQIDRLAKAGLLYLVTEKFANIDLHPDVVSNAQMGAVFEELIRKFAELSNETAGEHFTPREVIRLMVNLLFIEDDDALTKPGVVRSHLRPDGRHRRHAVASPASTSPSMNPDARLVMYGQELNPESYAICKADMLIKGQDIANIIFGNTLSDDGLPGKHFDYMLSNPPFGVEWKKIEKEVRKEARAAGLQRPLRPRPAARQRRLAAVPAAPASPRCARPRMAAAASASSSTARRCSPAAPARARARSAATCWRTTWSRPSSACRPTCSTTPASAPTSGSSATASPTHRKGKVQLIDASSFWQKMRKSLGSKRKELSPEHIEEITRLFGECKEVTQGRRADQPHLQERGLRLPHHHRRAPASATRPARSCSATKGKLKGKPQPDANLRDTENVPLSEDVDTYFKREVLPHAPDAWIDHEKTKVGYEIPFNRHFYVFKPPRALAEIDAELKVVTDRILTMIGGLSK